MPSKELVDLLKGIGIAGLLALAIYAALKGYIVGGKHFDKAVERAEYWQKKYTEIADIAIEDVKRRLGLMK